MVLKAFDEEDIPKNNLVSDQTDGCARAVMLGRLQGCHKYLKKEVKNLPDLGGCSAHDAANIAKNGVKKISALDLNKLFRCMWANLEKHSTHKSRNYMEMSDKLGFIYKHFPKPIDVRFRYMLLLAQYMESNDRPLYEYYSDMADKAASGKELSETETIILEIYIKNYLLVRLLNKFLIFAVSPLVKFIDFFESREIRVQHRYGKMVTLMHDHLSLFLKEMPADTSDPSVLLKIDFNDHKKFLSNKEILIGEDTRKFIKSMGLDVDGPELRPFFESVREYFSGSSSAMARYYKTAMTNPTLRYLSVLDPQNKNLPLDVSRTQWLHLAKQFPNLIKESQQDDLR